MKKQSYSIRTFFRLLFVSMFVTLILLLQMGCTFVPTPIRLLNKPHITEAKPSNNKRICLIVEDERHDFIQKINMCGITRTTIFLIPSSIIFLAHIEHLDSIVAHHIKKNLERQGYIVVRSYPSAPDELSTQAIDRKNLSKEDKKNAWAQRKSQDDKERRRLKAKKDKSIVTDLDEEFVSPWGSEVDTSDVDGVVEVKIRKFWTDYNYWGSFSWMSANLALCSAKDPQRKVLYGKKVRGLGYFFSFFTPLTPGYDVPVSLNTAYWFTIHSIEKEVSSPEFKASLENLQ